MFLRNVFRLVIEWLAKSFTRFAQSWKAVSYVIPASSVTASYDDLPGSLREMMFSPASRYSTISVVRRSGLILVRPATYSLSHFTLKRKVRYGSKRLVWGVMRAIVVHPLSGWLVDLLAQLEHDELGRFERREADQDVDDPQIDVLLRRGRRVARDEECVVGRCSLEGARAELREHERADVQPQARPERLVVRLEHRPLDPVVDARAQEDRHPAHRDVAPLRVGPEGARAPHDEPARRDGADRGDEDRVQRVLV